MIFYRYWPKCQSTQFLIDQDFNQFCYHRSLGVRQQPWGNNPIYLMLWQWRRVLYWVDLVARVTRLPIDTPQNFNIASSSIFSHHVFTIQFSMQSMQNFQYKYISHQPTKALVFLGVVRNFSIVFENKTKYFGKKPISWKRDGTINQSRWQSWNDNYFYISWGL